MGSKHRLLPWIETVLRPLRFDTVLDAFSGSGCVSYLLKTMGKQVTASDALRFTSTLSLATVENACARVGAEELARLLRPAPDAPRFIESTFTGIFYTPDDLRFLDGVCWNLAQIACRHTRAVATAALLRACVKRQPRGVFTIAGDPERYKDGRRDLDLSLAEHFVEQVAVFNATVFDNGRANRSLRSDVFDLVPDGFDLVYLDPPYVPRSDDNCYVKRYHFLEGLVCYWRGVELMRASRVRKIAKPFSPFGYRRTAREAFARLFARFARSTLVLSYSSNGYPDLCELVALMRGYKRSVEVFERAHTYTFGTHAAVRRASVKEYLVVGC